MPKRTVTPELRQERVLLRAVMRQLGRALSLTAVAVTAGPNLEDRAIAAMDESWEALADRIVEFAEDQA